MRLIMILFIGLYVLPCNGQAGIDYEAEMDKLIAESRFEEGRKKIIEWNQAYPEDRVQIGELYKRLNQAKHSAPKGAEVVSQKTFDQMMAQAALDADLDKMTALFDANPEKVLGTAPAGHPLLNAAYFGHADVVELLLSRGVNVNYVDAGGASALMRAASARNNRIEMVQLLIKSGADVNLKMINGTTALKAASRAADDEVIKILKEAGATE